MGDGDVSLGSISLRREIEGDGMGFARVLSFCYPAMT